MHWQPISLVDLRAHIARDMRAAEPEWCAFFDDVACEPSKWSLHPWGDAGGGFWVVARHQDRVVWFNDIEDGFNVSSCAHEGRIAAEQYACNQDDFITALRLLRDGGGERLGAPRAPDAS